MPGFDARPDRHPVGKKQNNPIGEGETRMAAGRRGAACADLVRAISLCAVDVELAQVLDRVADVLALRRHCRGGKGGWYEGVLDAWNSNQKFAGRPSIRQ